MLSSGRKDNRPLVTALALELLALNLRRVPTPSSVLERSEYARRDRDIVWYLLRGSIWETWTRCVSPPSSSWRPCSTQIAHRRPKLEDFANKTAHTPFIGIFSAFVRDWIPLINEYYYCTCGSIDFMLRLNLMLTLLPRRYCSIVLGCHGLDVISVLCANICVSRRRWMQPVCGEPPVCALSVWC